MTDITARQKSTPEELVAHVINGGRVHHIETCRDKRLVFTVHVNPIDGDGYQVIKKFIESNDDRFPADLVLSEDMNQQRLLREYRGAVDDMNMTIRVIEQTVITVDESLFDI